MKVSEHRQSYPPGKTYSSTRTAKPATKQEKASANRTNYQTKAADEASEPKTYWEEKAEKDKALLTSFQERTREAKEKKDSNFIKSSNSGESVGSYAALLAKAETRMEVMEVSSKVMRTLAELKMSSVGAEGDEAKKIAQKIRRLEKLVKRIQKKLKNLSKEEQLEIRKQRAIKKKEMEKAQELHKELENRRTKRRREDRKYAHKEMAEDMRTNDASNPLTSVSGSGADAFSDLSTADTGGIDVSMSGFEGGGLDVLA